MRSTIGDVLAIVLVLLLAFGPGLAWVINAYKLTQCDFQPPYKGEVTHAIGLIPGVAIVTMWNTNK